MEFKKYQHIERLGTGETQGILDGECWIFPKIDGTNASVWLGEDGVCAGSRRRQLSEEKDNAGFYKEIIMDKRIVKFLFDNPEIRVFGEWLVPHSLKTYRKDAWRKFYIFDLAVTDENDEFIYLSYETYQPMLEQYGLEYIPPLAKITNPSVESIYKLLDRTGEFLVEDGKGKGEGVVVKNYDYKNKYGRSTWAKVVTSEFKERHAKTMGAPTVIVKEAVEIKIVDKFCTEAFIKKEYAKIVNDNNGEWSSKLIPKLLNVIYYELIKEESWNIVKQFKNPTINFKTLYGFVTKKIKQTLPEVF